MNTVKETNIKSNNVEAEVEKLTSTVSVLSNISGVISLVTLVLGALSALRFGPLAFAIGAAIAVITSLVVKGYASTKKKEIKNNIIDLVSKHRISDNEATKLKREVELIYSDSPMVK